jgi:uncharacterized protein (TIGR04222 family)
MQPMAIVAWGISGPAFLVVYASVFAVTLAVVEVRRHQLLERAHEPSRPIDDLTPCELAYVAHGADDACVVALIGLERAGALRIENTAARTLVHAEPDPESASSRFAARRARKDWQQSLSQEAQLAEQVTILVSATAPAPLDPPDASSCRFERHLLSRVAVDGECSLGALHESPDLEAAGDELRSDLLARGYLLDDEIRSELCGLRWLWVPVVALGALRLLTALVDGGRPVGLLVLALAATVTFAWSRKIPSRPPGVERQLDAVDAVAAAADVERAFGSEPVDPADLRTEWALALVGTTALWAVTSPYALALAVPVPTSSPSSGCAACGGCGCGCGGCA